MQYTWGVVRRRRGLGDNIGEVERGGDGVERQSWRYGDTEEVWKHECRV